MGWTLGIRVLGIPIQIGFFALAARILPLADFGWFAMSNAVWQASRGLGPMGFDQAALRFVPPLLLTGRGDDAALLDRFARNRVLAIVSSGATAMLICAIGLWLMGQSVIATWCALTACGIPAFSLGALQTAQLRARRRVRSAQWPESIGLYVVAAAGVGAAAMLGWRSVTAVLIAETIAAYGMCGVCAVLLRAPYASAATTSFIELRASVVKTARDFFLGQLATALNGRVPTLLAAATLGTAAAGLLEAAMRIGQLGGIVTWAAGVAVSPMITEAHASRDNVRMQRLLTLSTLATLGPSIAVLAMVVVAGRWMLGAFGGQFTVAYVPMILIACSAAVNASGGLSGTVLYMTAGQRLVVVWSTFGLVTLLLMGSLLGLAVGITGIAVAMLASSLVRDVGLSVLLSRLTPVGAPIWTVRGLRDSRAAMGEMRRFVLRRAHGTRDPN
jgi:O-antigen/teichoic acid export membrane protein